jgi:uncharacterized membrane protein
VLATIFTVASPIIAHLILTRTLLTPDQRQALTYLLILTQMAIVVSMVLARTTRLIYKFIAVVSVAAAAAVCSYHFTGGLILSSGILHGLAYVVLLVLFGATLRPGAEPLISYFARKIHGQLSPELLRYTRGVTWAWCIFFGLEIATSALLFALAPIEWWSAFINLFNAPLILMLFLGEHLFRRLRFANPPRERIADIFRMVELMRTDFGKSKGDPVSVPPRP